MGPRSKVKRRNLRAAFATSPVLLFLGFAFLQPCFGQDGRLSIAKRQIGQGRSAEALSLLEGSSLQAAKNPEYYFLKARALQDLKKNTESLANYSIAIFLNPRDVRYYINRGLVRGALRDLEGAMLDLNYAIRLDPYNKAALLNRGVTHAGLGNAILALNDFNYAIKLDKGFADAYANRGITLFSQGKATDACNDWRKASSLGASEVKQWLSIYCIEKSP